MRLFNIRKNWEMVKPVLSDPDVISALDAGMYRCSWCAIIDYEYEHPQETIYPGLLLIS